MPVSREDGLDISTKPLQPLNGEFEPGVQQRTISENSDTGGGHMVVEIPAGWSNPRGYCTATQDIYILDGIRLLLQEKGFKVQIRQWVIF